MIVISTLKSGLTSPSLHLTTWVQLKEDTTERERTSVDACEHGQVSRGLENTTPFCLQTFNLQPLKTFFDVRLNPMGKTLRVV